MRGPARLFSRSASIRCWSSGEALLGEELAQAQFEDLGELWFTAAEALGQIVGDLEGDVGHGSRSRVRRADGRWGACNG